MTSMDTGLPDAHGRFGAYGGQFVPETLMVALQELTQEYEIAKADPEFQAALAKLLKDYVGRPTPLYFAQRLTERGGAQAREVELGRAIVESGSDTPIRYYQGRAAKYFRRGHIGKALVAIQNAVDVNPNWRDKKWRSVLNDMARYRRAKKK